MAVPFRPVFDRAGAPILPLTRFDAISSDGPLGHERTHSSSSSQASSAQSTLVASSPGSLTPSSTQTLVSLTQNLAGKGSMAPAHTATPAPMSDTWLGMTTLGANKAHQVVRVATVGWRSLLTASGAFVGGSTAQGLMHMAGFATATLVGPWVAQGAHVYDGVSEQAQPHGRGKKLLLGMVALGVFLDPAGQAGVMAGGAAGLLVTRALPHGSRANKFMAGALSGLLIEAGRVGVPEGAHVLLRRAQIRALDAQAALYPDVEDETRPWTQMAFVGSHLTQDLGYTPFSSQSPVPTPLAWAGMFASHQSLSIAQHFERGYDAFSFEFIGVDGVARSTHSTWWDYGTLADGLRQVADGLAAHPDRVVVIKLSAQDDASSTSLYQHSLVASGLWTYMAPTDRSKNYTFTFPRYEHSLLTKPQMRDLGMRAIVVGDDIAQTTYSADSVRNLNSKTTIPTLYGAQPWLLNLFTTWGFTRWSEATNLAALDVLQAAVAEAGAKAMPMNIILANDVETTGLLAFKRAYNAPRPANLSSEPEPEAV